MGTVTYPDPTVIERLRDSFVPCKLESTKAGDLPRKMNARWLPGLIVAGADERPAHVQVGFLPPQEFLVELDFGRAILAMGEKRYDDADRLFQAVADATPGGRTAERAPEAIYWQGISRYRRSKVFADCTERWSTIVARWPDSQWARKTSYALRG